MKKICKVLFYLATFSSLIIFINNETYLILWEIAFKILILIMFCRPLRDIFPKKLKFLNKIIKIRKELWIIAWLYAVAHSIWYLLYTDNSITLFFNSNLWYWDSFFMWWILGFFATIPALITSNIFSIKKLWKYWKKVQYSAYLMFIFTIIHIAFINEEKFFPMITLLFTYLIILFFAYYKNKKTKQIL